MSEMGDMWAGLQPASAADRLQGRGAPDMPARVDARLALDHRGLRHLLIAVPPDTPNVPHPRTRGLEVLIEPLESADGSIARHLNLACTEAAAAELFAVVVDEILGELRSSPTPPRDVVEEVLHRWSWFWSIPGDALGAEEMIGLFAELWFMEQWTGPVTSGLLKCWRGPFRDRHDFKSAAASVEVKATRASALGSPRHRISTLDQLDDPEQGRLHLFSLRVTPDPIGHHHLAGIVERISGNLAGDLRATELWNERLAGARYSPLHADRYREPLRIVAQELYEVRDGFPRLTRASFPDRLVPAGIDDISYTLDLAACADFRTATGPHERAAERVRRALG